MFVSVVIILFFDCGCFVFFLFGYVGFFGDCVCLEMGWGDYVRFLKEGYSIFK